MTCSPLRSTAALLIVATVVSFAHGAPPATDNGQRTTDQPDTSRGDKMLADYFRAETNKIEAACLAGIETREDWESRRGEYRRQLFEMLGFDPLPERTPLHPVVAGKVDHPEFTVEKLHFQSRPRLYVTGNLYVPKNLKGKAPTVLYVCGHGRVKIDGVSYGNKAAYQHHGAWFARNGYVCLTIDSLQLGEIEGTHHGTHHEGMWWWNARGYTPAGVEAWNCIRALDYLETRPEVDAERMGITGRSGGGIYSWWIAALDERIKVAVPVAGITTQKNHIVDGCVEGHCDCMFMVNTYRWDFPLLASLVAPRPLLISNSDKDGIFPLDGVVDVYFKTRRIYDLLGARDNLGLQITEGPHKDTQELRVHAFHWFNRHLKQDPEYKNRGQRLIETAAVKLFEPQELKVFDKLPEDELNTRIHETFVPKADEPSVPRSQAEWEEMKSQWMTPLREKCFRGWPDESYATEKTLDLKDAFSVEREGIRLSAYDFTSQENVRLRLYLAQPAGAKRSDLKLVVLDVVNQEGWTGFLDFLRPEFENAVAEESRVAGGGMSPGGSSDTSKQFRLGVPDLEEMLKKYQMGMAWIAPRGVGLSAWDRDARERVHIRRRFMLLGQTVDGMRVWDVRRAVQALRSLDGLKQTPLRLQGGRNAAGLALYASLFEPGIERLQLFELDISHRDGPIFLNVLRFLTVPQAVAMAAERSQVTVHQNDASGWDYPQSVAKTLGWGDDQIRVLPLEEMSEPPNAD